MPTTTYLPLSTYKLTLGGPAPGTDFSCQLASCTLQASANTIQVPGTPCKPVSQAGLPSTYALVVTWLQDVKVAAGLSQYAVVNDGKMVPFTFSVPDATGVVVTGNVWIQAGNIGGDIGAVAESGSITWNVDGAPTFTWPTATGLDTEPEPAQA